MKTMMPACSLLAALLTVAPGCGNKANHHDVDPTWRTSRRVRPTSAATPTRQTPTEILNSCPPSGVSVDKIDKKPTLPLLNADGTRPPLP